MLSSLKIVGKLHAFQKANNCQTASQQQRGAEYSSKKVSGLQAGDIKEEGRNAELQHNARPPNTTEPPNFQGSAPSIQVMCLPLDP